jgi:hypothetical protein
MGLGHVTIHDVEIIPFATAFRADPVTPLVLAVKHPLAPEAFDAAGIVRRPGLVILDFVDDSSCLEIMRVLHEAPPDPGDIIRGFLCMLDYICVAITVIYHLDYDGLGFRHGSFLSHLSPTLRNPRRSASSLAAAQILIGTDQETSRECFDL